MNLYAKNEMTRLLEKHGFFFKKNLGQNFLLNEAVAARIAAASRETLPPQGPALALEIGPGAGALTLQLSRTFDRVLALEIDPHLIPVLEESLEGTENVTVVCCDALRYSYDDLGRDYPGFSVAVCSNLPYCITSEILMRFLESRAKIESITVLIQKEAADRLTAQPGTADYGAITAAVSYYAAAEKLFTVGPGNFLPRPKVDSTVLRLTPRAEKIVLPKDRELFFSVIRAAFAARRKTLINALFACFKDHFSKEELTRAVAACGVSPERRGETLTLSEFCAVSDEMISLEESK